MRFAQSYCFHEEGSIEVARSTNVSKGCLWIILVAVVKLIEQLQLTSPPVNSVEPFEVSLLQPKIYPDIHIAPKPHKIANFKLIALQLHKGQQLIHTRHENITSFLAHTRLWNAWTSESCTYLELYVL